MRDHAVNAVLSANLLEHVPDDRRALGEIARILRPGGRAVIVVPANPRTYDYYERFLGHERRYDRGELAAKGCDAGLRVIEDAYLGSLIYPAFWLAGQAAQSTAARSIGGAGVRRPGRPRYGRDQ
jgi:SAM-dependent methyltransferase